MVDHGDALGNMVDVVGWVATLAVVSVVEEFPSEISMIGKLVLAIESHVMLGIDTELYPQHLYEMSTSDGFRSYSDSWQYRRVWSMGWSMSYTISR
jgi:hypothetical protein